LLKRLDPGGARLAQVVAALDALQQFVMANADIVESVDINPLLVSNTTCMAVDALIVLKAAGDVRPAG
jgi:hypothetical protein